MKITVLMEDSACPGFCCEHGLSLLIEWRGKTILLDAGSTDLFLENAGKLGADLSQVDCAVLSHGHYDHSGGFGGFFACNPSAPVYLRPQALEPALHDGKTGMRYIGVPESFLSQPQRLILVTGERELVPGLWLLPHSTPGLDKRAGRSQLYRQIKGACVLDDFSHEQSLVAETEGGLVIFSSCSHGGGANILDEVERRFPGRKVIAFFGGLHLIGSGRQGMSAPAEEVHALGRTIRQKGIQLYTGHCTGAMALEILREELGRQLHRMDAGTVVEL